ncbi:MAG: flagellar assembly peptidoglycan hydrolase FlgJ [Sulfuritalea sp.]|nr:flagellar assembly peptidoglycan hydrolase FlgJ [Sulfuritalea sp.]
MISGAAIPSVFDAQALARLRTDLGKGDPQALKAAARQFEAVLLQVMLKSMRAATPQNGPFDSDQTRFYQELLDAQLAQMMAARGATGLAAVIERQLAGAAATQAPTGEEGFPLAPPARSFPFQNEQRALPLPGADVSPPALPLEGSPVRPVLPEGVTRAVPSAPSFVTNVWPYAVAASRTTGIPAHFLVGHAALESGWGRSEPRFADGRPSHNLFGIKAGGGWTGAAVEATTTEYVNGVAERRVERFRAYGSYAEAFGDYARLLAQSPRYAEILGSRDPAGFAQGLQRAGYATDPAYASKLERVIGSLTLSLAGAPGA